MEKMKFKVVEEFLKENPDFYLYQINEKDKNLKPIIKSTFNDWESLNNPCVVNLNQQVITIADIIKNDVELYKVIEG